MTNTASTFGHSECDKIAYYENYFYTLCDTNAHRQNFTEKNMTKHYTKMAKPYF